MCLRQFTVRETQRILEANGYHKALQRSSHQVWKKNGDSVTLPAADLHSVICHRLIKEHELAIQ